MSDTSLLLNILSQIKEAIEKISYRFRPITKVSDFTDTPEGMEKLDSICMLFIAIGESLKKVDKLTQGELLAKYSEIDWKGVKGFRDIISHHYFDIDTEQVFWVCQKKLEPLSKVITEMIKAIEE